MTDHKICDACECVAHCSKQGCIPLTEPVIRRAEGGAAKPDFYAAAVAAHSAFRDCVLDDLRGPEWSALSITEHLQWMNAAEAAHAALQGGDAASEAVTDEQIEALDDLVTMVRRLARSLHKAAPNEPLTGLALDYLERKGFNTGPLRSAVNCEWTNCVHRVGDVCCNERAALNSTEKSDGWLPIASAPKDGTPVDLWCDGERLTGMRLVVISKTNAFYEAIESGPTCVRNATHWMPLPTAPKAHGGRNDE